MTDSRIHFLFPTEWIGDLQLACRAGHPLHKPHSAPARDGAGVEVGFYEVGFYLDCGAHQVGIAVNFCCCRPRGLDDRTRHRLVAVLGRAPMYESLPGNGPGRAPHPRFVDSPTAVVNEGYQRLRTEAVVRCPRRLQRERKEGRDYGIRHQGQVQALSHDRVSVPFEGQTTPPLLRTRNLTEIQTRAL